MMANQRGSGVPISPFDPQVSRDRSLIPGVYASSQTAETAQAVTQRMADKVGALADQLAQDAGTKAGLAAGADPGFRPTGGFTIKDRAFDRAATDTYLSNLSARFSSEALDVFDQHKDDPAGLKTAYENLVQTYRKRDVFPEIDGAFQAQATTLGTTLRRSALSGWEAKIKDQQQGALIGDMAARETAGQRLLALDPHAPEAEASYLRLKDENVANIKALVSSGAISAVQGEKMILEAEQNAQVSLAMARASTLATSDDVEAYRQQLRQKFAGGGLPGLSDWSSLDTALGALATKKRTETDASLRTYQSDLNDYLARAQTGGGSAADWATLEARAQALGPAGMQAVEITRRKLAGGRIIASLPPDQAQAYIDSLKEHGRSADGETALRQKESSGRADVENGLGYAGLYQFGAPRLADLGLYTPGAGENLKTWSQTSKDAPGKWTGSFNIPGHPEVKTLADFLASPAAQQATYAAHAERMDQDIVKFGLDRYIGQTVDGIVITRQGIHNMMHLGGTQGAVRFLTSGGVDNASDANGTTLSDYAKMGERVPDTSNAAANAEIIDYLEKLNEQNRKLVATDPLAAAAQSGMITSIAPVDFAAGTDDIAAALKQRVAQADAVAGAYRRAPSYIRPEEKPVLLGRIQKGGDEALSALMGVIKGAGAATPDVLKEISVDAPAMTHAALVAMSTGDVGFARQVAEAEKMRAEGGTLPQPDPSIVDQIVASEIGAALGSLDPAELARTRSAAVDWATVQIARRGLDAKMSPEVSNIVQEAVQRARGQTKIGDQAFGGVASLTYGGGYFRNEVKVQVPPDVKSDRFVDVLGAITDDNLTRLPDPPVGPDGRVLKADDLRRNAPFFAPGGYLFGMPDEATGGGVLVMARSGKPFSLSFDQVRPALRARVPDAFR